MKNCNYIIIGSSGGIGSQLCTDLTNCKSNLLLGYHENMPSDEFSDLKSMHVDATSFDSVMQLIQHGIEIFGNIHGVPQKSIDKMKERWEYRLIWIDLI